MLGVPALGWAAVGVDNSLDTLRSVDRCANLVLGYYLRRACPVELTGSITSQDGVKVQKNFTVSFSSLGLFGIYPLVADSEEREVSDVPSVPSPARTAFVRLGRAAIIENDDYHRFFDSKPQLLHSSLFSNDLYGSAKVLRKGFLF